MRLLAAVWCLVILLTACACAGDGSLKPLDVTRSFPLVARSGDGYVSVKGRDILAPDGSKLFLKGISLGNWLVPEGYMFKFDQCTSPRLINDAFTELVGPDDVKGFWERYRDRYVTQDDIRLIKAMGFNTVRIPFNYRLFTPETEPDIVLEKGFAVVDRVIGWARKEGLYVVLDMHGAPGGQTGENIDDGWGYPWLFVSPASQERTVKVWRLIAKRYRRERAVIGYELLNEPIPHFEEYRKLNEHLEPLYRRITKAIREVDSRHLVFLGGAQWNTNFSVFGKPFDDRLVYTFHRYWSEPTRKGIQQYLDFRERWNVPLWMGEAGENNSEWVATFRKLLEEHDIGWCFWPFKKMDSGSCVVSFSTPSHWEAVVKFADHMQGGTFGARRKMRPTLETGKAALASLLECIELKRCKVNDEYVKALGLTPPGAKSEYGKPLSPVGRGRGEGQADGGDDS